MIGENSTSVILNTLGDLDDDRRELVILRWDASTSALREVARHEHGASERVGHLIEGDPQFDIFY